MGRRGQDAPIGACTGARVWSLVSLMPGLPVGEELPLSDLGV